MSRDALYSLVDRIPETQVGYAETLLNGLTEADRFVFGVDLDGVVADFYRGLKPIAADWLGVDVTTLTDQFSYGLNEWGIAGAPGGYTALHRYAVKERDLFLNLMPVPGAAQVLRKLSEHDVRIRVITHRLYIKHFHRLAIDQTVAWLDKHDIPYWDLCFMQDKAAVGADLYIDDSPKNIQALQTDNLDAIIFTNSTNVGVSGLRANTWTEVENIVLHKVASWKTGHSGRALAGR